MESIYTHWEFIVFILVDVIVWFFLLRFFSKKSHGKPSSSQENGEQGDDDSGIQFPEDPKLDLPPGVTLPTDRPVEVLA